MSLIVTVRVSEGIIMAADSRVSVHVKQNNDETRSAAGIRHFTDSFPKIFTAPNGAGISFCGEMALGDNGMHVMVKKFIDRKVHLSTPVEKVPGLLLEDMLLQERPPATIFHVCGYLTENGEKIPCMWRVIPRKNIVEVLEGKPMVWDGEGDILARLLSPVDIRTPLGEHVPLPDYPVAFNMFTLQDAADFADYAVKVTMESMRFSLRAKTVGGQVDVLAITPGGTHWLRKKELGVSL